VTCPKVSLESITGLEYVRKMDMASKIEVVVGQRFGRLTLVREVEKYLRGRYRAVVCRCDCGRETTVRVSHLVSRSIVSCGCWGKQTNLAHGMSKTLIYKTWTGLMSRVYYTGWKQYKDYGGRGIRVSERWHIFENFFEDMGYPPGSGYSLDRVDNDGDYEKENCRWATCKEQHRNTRSNIKVLTEKGVLNLIDYCDSRQYKSAIRRIKRVRGNLRKGKIPLGVLTSRGTYRFTPEEVAIIISQPHTDVMDLYLRRSL
jgi:hypothetical protein